MHVNDGEKTSSQQDSNNLKLGDVGNFLMKDITQNLVFNQF